MRSSTLLCFRIIREVELIGSWEQLFYGCSTSIVRDMHAISEGMVTIFPAVKIGTVRK